MAGIAIGCVGLAGVLAGVVQSPASRTRAKAHSGAVDVHHHYYPCILMNVWAVVHVHPKAPTCCTNLVQSNPWAESSLLEFPFDSGRTIFDLLQSGALVKFPDIQWIFSHLGGVIPMLAGRLRDVGPGFWRDLDIVAPKGIDHELRRLHYDTAASAYEPSMRAALAYIPPENLHFGTDHPHYDVSLTVDNFMGLRLSRSQRGAILSGNSRRIMAL